MSAYSDLQELWQLDLEMAVYYLLVQSGKILSVSESPVGLFPNGLDERCDWAIYIGHINEFGAREVVAPVAMVEALDPRASVCRISSTHDGKSRLIGVVYPMLSVVKIRLQSMHKSGEYADLCQLPAPLTIMRALQLCESE